MRRERVRFYFQKIIVFSMACCMLTNLAVPVSFAKETGTARFVIMVRRSQICV